MSKQRFWGTTIHALVFWLTRTPLGKEPAAVSRYEVTLIAKPLCDGRRYNTLVDTTSIPPYSIKGWNILS